MVMADKNVVDESTNLRFTLANGLVIEGRSEVVMAMLEKFGLVEDGVHYLSASKGLILIEDMHTLHIRGAILKILRGWVEDLKSLDDKDFLEHLRKGAGAGNITLLGLVKGLASRV